MGFPGGSVVKNLPVSAEDAGSILGSGRSPGERKWQPTPVLLPRKSHGQRNLAVYLGLHKSWTQLSDYTTMSIYQILITVLWLCKSILVLRKYIMNYLEVKSMMSATLLMFRFLLILTNTGHFRSLLS